MHSLFPPRFLLFLFVFYLFVWYPSSMLEVFLRCLVISALVFCSWLRDEAQSLWMRSAGLEFQWRDLDGSFPHPRPETLVSRILGLVRVPVGSSHNWLSEGWRAGTCVFGASRAIGWDINIKPLLCMATEQCCLWVTFSFTLSSEWISCFLLEQGRGIT